MGRSFAWVLGALLVSTSCFSAELKFADETMALAVRDEGGPAQELKVSIRKPVPLGEGERLPALMVFGGFQNAARVLELVQPERRVLLASFDYPFDPPRRFEFPGSLKHAPAVKKLLGDTRAGIRALAKALASRSDVDPKKISVVGASLGAPFAVAAAPLAPEITGVVLIHGFGDVPATAEAQLARAWNPRFGSLARPAAWVFSRLAWWYLDFPDPERVAETLTATQKVFQIDAEADSFIPRSASASLWAAIARSPSSSERLVMPGEHLLPGSEDRIRVIMRDVTRWLERSGLL